MGGSVYIELDEDGVGFDVMPGNPSPSSSVTSLPGNEPQVPVNVAAEPLPLPVHAQPLAQAAGHAWGVVLLP